MKRFIAFVFAALLFEGVFADTEWVNGVTYTYSIENGEAKIGKYWLSAAISTSTAGAITIPSTLGGCPVTEIGSYTFYDCSLLESVTIPDGVTAIGDEAFYRCRSLKSVSIPDSVTTIGDRAFCACDSLTSITISEYVTTIGENTFDACSSLKEVIGWRPGCPTYVERIVIARGVTEIDQGAFVNCSSLKSITIPNSVATIGSYAFEGCSSLTSISIPNSVATIGSYAFEGCSSLTSISMPNSVVSIGNFAFRGCSSLMSIVIPIGVAEIGWSVFSECSSLRSVTIPDSVTEIGSSAFYNCGSLKSVTIPDSVTTIEHCAFYGCSSIESVTIPNGVVRIGQEAFRGCSLTTLEIPEGVREIGAYAFDCNSLKTVVLPSSVESVASRAFANANVYAPLDKIGALDIPNLKPCLTIYDILGGGNRDWNVPEGTGVDYVSAETPSLTECGAYSVEIEGPAEVSWMSYAKNGASWAYGIRFYLDDESLSYPKDVYDGYPTYSSVVVGSGLHKLTWSLSQRSACLAGLEFRPIEDDFRFKYLIEDSQVKILDIINGKDLTSLIVPSEIEGFPVVSIDSRAFKNCGSLESVVLPMSIKSVDSSIFSECTNLREVEGPILRYGNVPSVTRFIVPEGVTGIESFALSCFPSLEDIVLPDTITLVSNNAFAGTKLVDDTKEGPWIVDGCLIGWGGEVPANLVIPGDVRHIADNIFQGCQNIETVTLSEGLISIGNYAFYGATSLREFDIPSSVRRIGRESFLDTDFWNDQYSGTVVKDGCALGYKEGESSGYWTSISLPDDTRLIADYAFANVSNAYLGSGYYYNQPFEWPSALTEISEGAFAGCMISKISIPSHIKKIGSYAFDGHKGLDFFGGIEIAEGVEEIGDYAFRRDISYPYYWYYSEISFYIPKTVQKIGVGSFENYSFVAGEGSWLSLDVPRMREKILGVYYRGVANNLFSASEGYWVENGMVYRVENGSVAIYDMAWNDSYGVSIPDEIQNFPVTRIAYGAFDNICNMGGWYSSATLTMPSSLRQIDAYWSCGSDWTIVYNDAESWLNVKYSEEGANPSYYNNNTTVQLWNYSESKLVTPPTISVINDFAFCGCDFDEIIISEGVNKIGRDVFANCCNLHAIEFPSTLAMVDASVAYGNIIFLTVDGEPLLDESDVDIAQKLKGKRFVTRESVSNEFYEQPSVQNSSIVVTTEFVFDGIKNIPTIDRLEIGGFELVLGIDYQVEVPESILPGSYELTIRGIGKYHGELTIPYLIKNAEIVIGDIVGYEGVYDGQPHGITVVVESPVGTSVIFSDKEQGSYGDAIELTDVCDTNIWFEASAQYYNSVTGSAQVVILPRSIETETLIAYDRVVAWNGELPCPQVCVTNEVTGALMPGRDFRVTYLDNDRVGTARVVIDGVGNYCGSVTNEFTITKGSVFENYDPEAAPNQFLWQWTGLDHFPSQGLYDEWKCDFDYDGTEKSVWIYTNDNADIVDIAITGVTNAVNAGVYTARARGTITRYATDDFYNYTYVTTIDSDMTMTIKPRDLSEFSAELLDDVFFIDGAVKSPAVTVYDPDLERTLLRGADYDIVYSPLVIGERTATVVGKGNYKGTITRQFTLLDKIENLPKPVIKPESKISGASVAVVINYAKMSGYETEIRYTIDGDDPTATSLLYSGKFNLPIVADTTIRAAAFLRGVRVSEIVSQRYLPTIESVIVSSGAGCGPVSISTSGASAWTLDINELGYDGTPTMRSGHIADEEVSEMSATFSGDGVFEFWWKTSCESDTSNARNWDRAECCLDGTEVARLDGVSGWTNVQVKVETKGDHTILWRYHKDGTDEDPYPGEDCAWVDGVKFTFAAYIDFAADEEIAGELPARIVSAAGYSVALPEIGDVTYEKHAFSGWLYEGKVYQPGELLLVDRQEMTVKPTWTEVLEVTYDLNGGEGSAPEKQYAVLGSSIMLSDIGAANMAKHSFGGWSLGEDKYAAGDEFTPAEDVTFVATWVPKTLLVPVIDVIAEHDDPSTIVTISHENATIYYTIDGTEPSETNGMRYEAPFEVRGSATIKAIAIKDDYFDSEVVEASVVSTYTPTSVGFDGGEGVIGTMPSAIDTALRREIVLPEIGEARLPKHSFGGWTDGVAIYQPGETYAIVGEVSFAAIWEEKHLAAPAIAVPTYYEEQFARVEMTTVDEGASLHYSIDGGEWVDYVDGFRIEGSHEIRAYATKDDYFDSEISTAETERAPWTIGECVNLPKAEFVCSGDADWVRDLCVSYDGKASMRSGAVGNKKVSKLQTAFVGAGTLSFRAKVSSEADDDEAYDGLMLYVDGIKQWDGLLGGEIGWVRREVTIEGEWEHTIVWSYEKDKSDSYGDDCAWIDDVAWTPYSACPPEIEAADETVKAAFNEWIVKYDVKNPGAANVNAFVLGLAPTATEEEIQETVEEELSNLDLGKLVEGDVSAAVAEIQAKYPNAKVDLAPVEDLNSSAHLYKLVIKLK